MSRERISVILRVYLPIMFIWTAIYFTLYIRYNKLPAVYTGTTLPPKKISKKKFVIYSCPLCLWQVKATDHGNPNKSSTARISVEVVALQEVSGPPFVKVQHQTVEVTEADPVGFLVAMVQAAQDTDYLWYNIVGGYTL